MPQKYVSKKYLTRRPISEDWDWQLEGLCRQIGNSVFFHPDGERGLARAARIQIAKTICNRCPVVAQCRVYALSVNEPYGIWGGMSENERRKHVQVRRIC